MEKYDHRKVENKWRKAWMEDGTYQQEDMLAVGKNEKFFNLWMFPYPSAEGLHAGHAFASTGSDIIGRYFRMNGKEVFQPMVGYDSFGIHAENYAIKIGEHPMVMLERVTKHYGEQMHTLGHGYDWTRTVTTSDINYYKWTQWLFLQLFKAGLAYRKAAKVNWCPSCKTVLADEQVVTPAQAGKDPKNADGEVLETIEGMQVCERCATLVEEKKLEQWFFRITDYADRLLENLEKIDWSERVVTAQRNWIGKSNGATLKFEILSTKHEINPKTQIQNKIKEIEVFTTRPDTLYGATFIVVSPEYAKEKLLPIISESNKNKVTEYINISLSRTKEERVKTEKQKTGVDTGIKAINPATGEETSVLVADYVLSEYGTGAIMGVPAHDQRDFEFAKKYNLPIIDVVMPVYGNSIKGAKLRKTVSVVVHRKHDDKYLILKWKKFNWISPVCGGIDEGEDWKAAAEREVLEETGYKTKAVRKLGECFEANFFAENKNEWRKRIDQPVLVEIELDEPQKTDTVESNKHVPVWMSAEEALEKITHEYNKLGLLRHIDKNIAYSGEGKIVNSGSWDGLKAPQEMGKVVKDIEAKGWGKGDSTYHLRDWLVSRQRYWGAPIPMIYCEVCAKGGRSWFSESSKSQIPSNKQITNDKLQNREKIGNWKLKIENSLIREDQGDWEHAGWWPEEKLPVELPYVEDYKPEGTGRGPLSNHPEFYEVECPYCGEAAKRETDVMDTFVDSSWYFLRYPSVGMDDISQQVHDRHIAKSVRDDKAGMESLPALSKRLDIRNSDLEIPWHRDVTRRWLPVDLYFGGAEHSVLHLMYSRFVTMVLHDLKYLEFEEPFPRFFAHGLMIKDGAKMSKSRGNVVNPDEYIEKFGADTLRLYLMFMGPMDGYPDFRDTGIEGMRRFTEKVWKLFQVSDVSFQLTDKDEKDIAIKMHQSIKKVTIDIEKFHYNTAIAAIMEYVNELRSKIPNSKTQIPNKFKLSNSKLKAKQKLHNTNHKNGDTVWDEALRVLLLLLAPFTPYMAEELWQIRKSDVNSQKSDLGLRVGQLSDNRKTGKNQTDNRNPKSDHRSIHLHPWPTYDPEMVKEETVQVVVQVNGKLRGTLLLDTAQAQDKELIIKAAKSDENVAKWLDGKIIKKEIFVPGKLVNLVL